MSWVCNLLEAASARDADELRISAQLVEAKDGFHLWSGTYDRYQQQTFAIQEDIARQVTSALKVKLLAGETEGLVRRGTDVSEAHNKYLIASAHIRRAPTLWLDSEYNLEHLKAARRLLESAIDLDPDYAEAWAKLVGTYYLLAMNGVPDDSGEMLTLREAIELAGPAVERARELAPDLPETWIAVGWDRAVSSKGRPAAIEDTIDAFEHALALDPDNVEVLETYAQMAFLGGAYEHSARLYGRALTLDPLSPARMQRARAVYRAGQSQQARDEALEVARLYPDAPYAGLLAQIEFDKGHLHHGLLWLEDFPARETAAYAWAALGDIDRALREWGRNAPAGGSAREHHDVGELLLRRDYEQFGKLASETADSSFALAAFSYLSDLDSAIARYEALESELYFSLTTGTGDARGREIGPYVLGVLATRATYYAHALAASGRRDEAVPMWNWALELASRRPQTTPRFIQETHHTRLLVYASRGEVDAALTEFESMADAGWRWLMSPGLMNFPNYSVGFGWLEDSPLLDSIRDEPRFIAVLERIEAENAAMLTELEHGLALGDIRDEQSAQAMNGD